MCAIVDLGETGKGRRESSLSLSSRPLCFYLPLSVINAISNPLLTFLIDLWSSWYNNLVLPCAFIFTTLIFVICRVQSLAFSLIRELFASEGDWLTVPQACQREVLKVIHTDAE